MLDGKASLIASVARMKAVLEAAKKLRPSETEEKKVTEEGEKE